MGLHNKQCFAHIFNLANLTDQQLNAIRANVQASASDKLQALFILTERDHATHPNIDIGINGFKAVVNEYKCLNRPNDKDNMILGYAYFNLILLYDVLASEPIEAVDVQKYLNLCAQTKAPFFINAQFWQDNSEARAYAIQVNKHREMLNHTTSSSVANHATNLQLGVEPEQIEREATCCCAIC